MDLRAIFRAWTPAPPRTCCRRSPPTSSSAARAASRSARTSRRRPRSLTLETDDLAALDRTGDAREDARASARRRSPSCAISSRPASRATSSNCAPIRRPACSICFACPDSAAPKIHLLHEALGIDSVDALEAAARDGRLAKLKGFGPKTAQKILRGIEFYRARRARARAAPSRRRSRRVPLLAMVRAHPDVARAEVAGSVRRHGETIGDTDIVAACRVDPRSVAASFARAPGVRDVARGDTPSPAITYVDGTRLDLHCVRRGRLRRRLLARHRLGGARRRR